MSDREQTWHALPVADLPARLETDLQQGLAAAEAQRRLEQFGPNRFAEKKPRTVWHMLLDQFRNFLVLVLVAAAVVSFVVGFLGDPEAFTDAGVILAILILNAILGVVQEYKANQALEALKRMSVPRTEVRRGGQVVEVDSDALVPGDVVLLREGDFVPADMRLAEAHSLQIDEASLTGESEPVHKRTEPLEPKLALNDRRNMAYAGTITRTGRGVGVVVATGMEREVGRIAAMLQQEEETLTPMQRRLAGLGKALGIAALGICALVFLVGWLYGHEVLEMFMVAVSLAVAAIPEGLPAIVTVVLALGVYRMSRHHAIVRKLPAVETLGAATYICTDKTGTLTQNRMDVRKALTAEELLAAGPEAYQQLIEHERVEKVESAEDELLVRIAVLCNDAELPVMSDLQDETTGQNEQGFGDPTELALLEYAEKHGRGVREMRERFPRVDERPFESERKRMSTLNDLDGRRRVLVKGGPDVLLERCTRMQVGGRVEPMSDGKRARIQQALESLAGRALRVLAFAWKEGEGKDALAEPDEEDLVFVGLVGMMDPPREEAKAALERAHAAGIRTVMITGDNLVTARAIADQLGMLGEGDEAITGTDLEQTSDAELQDRVGRLRVLARAWPELKLRIVGALQARGHVVAMTGDGVNDAPALKKADIGVAMGITGTDVAKGTADLVLTDDNFATIVRAVEEGRKIFDNIRKFVVYLLACNMGEMLAILVPILLGWLSPLAPVQILLINLITDGLPAMALGVDAPVADIMRRRPRSPREGIVHRDSIFVIGFNAIMIGASVILAFWIGTGGDTAGGSHAALLIGETMAFVTLGMGELWRAYSFRSMRDNVWRIDPRTNLYLVGACVLSALILLAAVTVGPLTALFDTTSLSAWQWGVALLLSLLPVAAFEAWKPLYRRMRPLQGGKENP